jgi:hypothetical protein
VQIDTVNENIEWRDAIILKPVQIEKHSNFNADGHTIEVSSPKEKLLIRSEPNFFAHWTNMVERKY